MALKGLLVDVGGTLLPDPLTPEQEIAFDKLRRERMAAEFSGVQPWFDATLMIGNQFEGPNHEQTTRAALEEALAAQDVEFDDHLYYRLLLAQSVPWKGNLELFPGVPEALGEIKALGIPMVVCSNTGVRGGWEFERDLGELGIGHFFEAMVTSLDVGYHKPHPAMFEACLEVLGLDAEHCAMVGDKPERDILGANALGIRTIWIRPPERAGTCVPRPDAEIASLIELPAIVRGWLE